MRTTYKRKLQQDGHHNVISTAFQNSGPVQEEYLTILRSLTRKIEFVVCQPRELHKIEPIQGTYFASYVMDLFIPALRQDLTYGSGK